MPVTRPRSGMPISQVIICIAIRSPFLQMLESNGWSGRFGISRSHSLAPRSLPIENYTRRFFFGDGQNHCCHAISRDPHELNRIKLSDSAEVIRLSANRTEGSSLPFPTLDHGSVEASRRRF